MSTATPKKGNRGLVHLILSHKDWVSVDFLRLVFSGYKDQALLENTEVGDQAVLYSASLRA